PSLGQRNPGLLGSAASTRSNTTAGLGSFRACRWILSPSFVLVPVRRGAGANNDINVLDNSPLFDDLLDDLAPMVSYVVNGVEYRDGYYLADEIYPDWASFVKSFTVATDLKHTYFKQRQESARKDVERAFGVLQGRWGLIQPTRAYEVNTLRRIMYAGIIIHNLILEDQNLSIVDLNHVYSNPARSMQTMWIDRCKTQRRNAKELRDRDTHISLQQNLMNHIWREVEEASEED
nr:protein ALP1-like isoform X1 [Tanacetum cinerariifolium]